MPTIRLQAKLNKKGITEVKALIQHPMEIGNRQDLKTGEPVDAHFIEEVICEYKDKVVMSANWGGGISKNPFLSFRFRDGAVGEKVKLTWKDNQGQSDSHEAKIKKSRR